MGSPTRSCTLKGRALFFRVMNHALSNHKTSSDNAPSSTFKTRLCLKPMLINNRGNRNAIVLNQLNTRQLMRALQIRARVPLGELYPQVFGHNSRRFPAGTTWLVPHTQIFVDKLYIDLFKLVVDYLGDDQLAPLIGKLLLDVSPTKRRPWSCLPGAVTEQEMLTRQPSLVGC